MKILVVLISGLGDFVESTPVLKAIRKKYGKDLQMDLLVSDRVYGYASKAPFIDHTYSFSLGAAGRPSKNAGAVLENLKKVLRLRHEKYDIAFNFYGLGSFTGALRMAALFKLIGAKNSIGRDTEGYGFFYNIKVRERSGINLSQYDYYTALAKEIGIENADTADCLWFDKKDEQNVSDLISLYPSKAGFVVINPCSFRPSRLWDSGRFAYCAEKIIEKSGYRVFISGEDENNPQVREITDRVRTGCYSIAGKLSPGGLYLFLKSARLLISTNSSVMHIGAFSGIPVLGLIGPGNPWLDMPGKKDKFYMFQKKTDCAPCYLHSCKQMTCMSSITAGEVLEKALSVIARDR